jgi:hypothetical protein
VHWTTSTSLLQDGRSLGDGQRLRIPTKDH